MTILIFLFTFCYADSVVMYPTPEVFYPVFTVSIEESEPEEESPVVLKEDVLVKP